MPRSSAKLRRIALTAALSVSVSVLPVSTTNAAPGPPSVIGANSTSNTSVLVVFDEAMSSDALDRESYRITQENINTEAGTLRVVSAAFDAGDRSRVRLETLSQAELVYRVTVVGAEDRDGDTIENDSSATFSGTPADVDLDSDGDGLADHVESRGWTVTVRNFNGTTSERGVTSNPTVADTDGDGLSDAEEASLRLDPRTVDTDDDRLDDRAEVEDLYSDPVAQDTDTDGIADYGEVAFFRTSPVLSDTDGDQLPDRGEVVGNRNPRVSDLPRPEIDVGEIRLSLDVRFSETNATERRTLDSKNVTSTLTQSDTRTFSRQDTVNVEAHLDAGTAEGNPYIIGGASLGYTFQQSTESQSALERAHERSLTTEREATKGFVVEREIAGGTMQVALSLRNDSTLAYRVDNLQITAFIQNPRDRTNLTPVATLVPDAVPDGGFTLGPLVTDRGPFIFSNTTIEPSLIDSLMANSSGLVFRVSNYDIVDEDGRNFAFTSQEVAERTSRLVIDFGGASSLRAAVSGEEIDENAPGDQTELHRVATNSGRPIEDTNGDGRIDDDPREIFDEFGASLGLDVNGDGEVTDQSYTVRSLAWSHDDRTLATASDDGLIRLWSATTGRVRATLRGHDGPVNAIDWSGDGTSLATAGSDGTIRLWTADWNAEPARRITATLRETVLSGHDGEATAVAWSPDGTMLATGGSDSNVLIFDVASGDETERWTNHRLSVSALDWTSDGTTLASSARGGDVRIWDVVAGRPTVRLGAHNGAVNDVEWSPDNTSLASAGVDGDVRLWDAETLTTYLELSTEGEPARALAWSPDGSAIAVAGDEALVRIWDPISGTTDRTLSGHAASVGSVAWSNSGARIASAADDQQVLTWSTTSDTVSRTITGLDDNSYVPDTRVTFDGDGRQVGVTLHEALAAIGLTRYDETETPSEKLSNDQRLTSYSTRTVDGVERMVRIRGVANDGNAQKFWEVLTPLGVDADADIGELVLTADSAISLNFVQDLDGDLLTADVEYFLRTSDSPDEIDARERCGEVVPVPRGRDTDGDCLDDRFEALVGWTVDTPQRSYPVWSTPNRADSDFDDPDCQPDGAPLLTCPFDSSDTFAAPAGWADVNGNSLRDPGEVFPIPSAAPDLGSTCADPATERDYVLDPIRQDTDRDGISDADEIDGFVVERLSGVICVRTNPVRQFTDGDTFTDGIERAVGLDPTDSTDTDTDGDGLPDEVERAGWTVEFESISTDGHASGTIVVIAAHGDSCPGPDECIRSDPENPDSDGDGLGDLDEFLLRTNPRSSDTDGDGIDDQTELAGFALPHQIDGREVGIITTDPLDADSDNDRRSDGDEAELAGIETQRWIVRVLGEAPYRVFSHPLVADADYDGLVDGDEHDAGTDPSNGNTDGDRRADDVERDLGTNPLAVDLLVTVIARSLEITPDDVERYALNVKRPDENGPAGLGTEPEPVFEGATDDSTIGFVEIDRSLIGYVGTMAFRYIAPGSLVTLQTGGVSFATGQGGTYDPGDFGVPAGSEVWLVWSGGNTVEVPERYVYRPGSRATARYHKSGLVVGQANLTFIELIGGVGLPQDTPLEDRSLTFGIAEGQRFSIEGFVQQGVDTSPSQLGGLEGAVATLVDPANSNPPTVRPVFSWDDIRDTFIEDYVFDVTVDGVNVKLHFYFIVQ